MTSQSSPSNDPAAFEGIEDDDEFAEADVECAETDNDAPVVQAEDADGFDGVLEAEYEVIDEDEDVLADNCEEDADMASDDMTIEDGESADGDVDVEDVDETSRFDGIDVEDDDEPIESVDLSGTVAMPVVRPVETVDSLMAQIDSATPVRPQRPISVPSTADAMAMSMSRTLTRPPVLMASMLRTMTSQSSPSICPARLRCPLFDRSRPLIR